VAGNSISLKLGISEFTAFLLSAAITGHTTSIIRKETGRKKKLLFIFMNSHQVKKLSIEIFSVHGNGVKRQPVIVESIKIQIPELSNYSGIFW
jgi:hypothetical protein